jgi:hypothetical protein
MKRSGGGSGGVTACKFGSGDPSGSAGRRGANRDRSVCNGRGRILRSHESCVDFPLCGVFTFDAEDRLAGERIYYDRATVLRQLGVFREPSTWLGRMVTALAHPVTIVRADARGARVPARTAVPPPPGSTPT